MVSVEVRGHLWKSPLSCRSQVVKACALRTSTCRTTWQALLDFCFILMKSSLLLSKQTATDSSSNSSQKREQHTRTVSSPTSCEHRRIYTLDPYPVDHYHPDQVSRGLHSHGNTRTAPHWPSPSFSPALPTAMVEVRVFCLLLSRSPHEAGHQHPWFRAVGCLGEGGPGPQTLDRVRDYLCSFIQRTLL